MKNKLLICCLLLTNRVTQAQISTPFNAGIPTDYVGWNAAQNFPLRIEQRNTINPNPIDFFNNGIHRMRLNGNGGATDGFFGIGDATAGTNFATFPNHRLDVDLGDININQFDNGYRIGGSGGATEYVLWHNGNDNNIFVGVSPNRINITGSPNTCVGFNAGDGILGGSANVIIGDNAGLVLTGSGGNTFVGHEAGMDQNLGGENTFIGSFTGTDNVSGSGNTYVGADAGRDCISTDNNTMVGNFAGNNNLNEQNSFFGAAAGITNDIGRQNTYIGFIAGRNNSSGAFNTALGAAAGQISLGSSNTFLGCSATVAATGLINVVALGAGSIVPDVSSPENRTV